MKWKYYNNQWHDTNGVPGTPAGRPPANPKNGSTTYDDGVGAPSLPPAGYTIQTSFGGNKAWVKDSMNALHGSSSLMDKLVDGAYNNHNEWHLSGKIKGATSSDYYLHDYSTNTLFLLDQSVGNCKSHDDGVPMIEILKIGQVKNGMHCF